MKRREQKIMPILWALAAALAVSFLLESAVARRVGADLFLPVRLDTGAFLPGRLARLAACLVLGFALALTERGRRLGRSIRSFCRRDRGCWALAAAVTALFFLWAWRVTVVSFMTNDETQILRAIGDGSYRSLTAAFTHPWLCAALNWLYRAIPGGHWYAWYHLAVLAASLLVLGRCVYLKTRRRGWPVGTGMLLHWLLGMGLILLPFSSLSFTVTPAVAGSAAAALLLCRNETESAVGHAVADVGSALLIVLCWLQRADTGRALLCFWALAFCFQLARLLLTPKPGRLRQSIQTVICGALALVVLTAAIRTPRQLRDDWDTGYDYSTAEYYRSAVMDYSLDKLSNEQLQAVGLPPELTALLRDWYFMDSRISTDTFRAILETYPDAVSSAADALADTAPAAAQEPPAQAQPAPEPEDSAPAAAQEAQAPAQTPSAPANPPLSRLRNMLSAATAIMTDDHRATARLMTAGLLLLAAILLLRFARCGRSGLMDTLCGLCAAGGAAAMLLRLTLDGRMPLRAFLVPVIPAAAIMTLTALEPPANPARSAVQKAAGTLTGLLALALAALCPVIAAAVPFAGEAIARQEVFSAQDVMEEYVAARPDITFITNDLDNDLDPFHAPDSYPANLTRWGGNGVTATTDRLYADAFFRDDVLFLCKYPSTIVALLQYLTLDWGPVEAQLLESLPQSLSVTDISRITPGEGYTGWYEYNGMTYYFQDGQALAGEQTIDGETYIFAPAGVAAGFIPVAGPNGSAYTTDAYSLLAPEAQ